MDKLKEKLLRPVSKEEIIEFLKNNLLTIYIIFNLAYILIGTFLVKTYYMYFSEYSYGYIYLLGVNIVITILLFITKMYKKKLVHLFTALIIIFSIISTIFAIKPVTALYRNDR